MVRLSPFLLTGKTGSCSYLAIEPGHNILISPKEAIHIAYEINPGIEAEFYFYNAKWPFFHSASSMRGMLRGGTPKEEARKTM
jgi:hypothetical protein